jgi:hypothetical protein
VIAEPHSHLFRARQFAARRRRITPIRPALGADPMGSNPPYELVCPDQQTFSEFLGVSSSCQGFGRWSRGNVRWFAMKQACPISLSTRALLP